MNRILITFFLGVIFLVSLPAQELPSEKVEVVKNFEARLADANKLRLDPEAEAKEVSDRKFSYEVEEKILPIEYLPVDIRPASIRSEDMPDVYNGFVKAGFGYPLSPYLDAGYRLGRSDGSNVLARFTHHSANNNNIENQRFSINDFLVEGTLLTDYGFAVDGVLDVDLDRHYFYGYDQSDTTVTFDKNDVVNKINIFEIGGRIYNATETTSTLNYWAEFKAYLLANNFATRETDLTIDVGLTKWFGDNPLTVELGSDLTRLKDTVVQTLNNFYINPSFSFGTRDLRIKFGASLATSMEEFHFFPDVEVLYNLLGNNLTIFAGADGGLRKNSFRALTDYNPFLDPHLSDMRNSKYYDFYGGVKGIVSGLEYSLQGGYKPTSDLALFQTNLHEPWIRFDVLYDTVNIIYFKGSLKGQLFDNFHVSGSVVQNIYDTKTQEEAWYLPNLQVNAGVSYLTLSDQLRLKAEIYFTDAVAYQDDPEFGEAPNALFDVSLGADFFITENFGLFLHLNNLAANEYRRWYNYPTYGINVLAGITARF